MMCLLRSGSVTSLKLISCNVGQRQINMRALRCLFLSYVDLDEAIVRNILARRPVLKALSVKHCVHLRELSCDSRQLKRLKVSPSVVGGPKLRVICPRIISLSLSGWIEVLTRENISSVEEITFDFRNSWIFLRDRGAYGEYSSHENCRDPLPSDPGSLRLRVEEDVSSNSWRHLVIRTTLAKENLPGIRNLLRSSTCLESLCLKIVRGKPFQTEAQSKLMHRLKLDEENYWDSEDHLCLQCAGMGERLESIVVMGEVVNSRVLRLMRLLLRNASVLRTVVVSASLDNRSDLEKEWDELSWSDSSEEEEDESEETWEEFSAKLCALPRASSHAIIHGAIGHIEYAENQKVLNV